MEAKKIYNLISEEDFNDAKIINGNPSGIINFEKTNHKWATSLWDLMESRTWFPKEINVSSDKTSYPKLTEYQHRSFDLVLAQLITNDSIQTNQLMDSINRYITSPVVNACLSRQSYEEANHSRSYAVMAEDICGDTDRIYNMHKHDEGLARKNNAVAQMYAKVNSSDNPSDYDVLKAAAANQILEKLVFPSGFVILWSMKSLMPGTGQMISSIDRDEDSHVILFKNIFRSIKNQIIESSFYHDTTLSKTIEEIKDMIIDMAEEEKIWAKYASKGLLGFSEAAIDKYVEFKANAVCKNLKIDNIYTESNGGPLYSIEVENSLLIGDKKTNFFETQVVDYSVGSLQGDF